MMRAFVIALTLGLLAGCATGPRSPSESVAACYATIETKAKTANDMRARGALSDSERVKVAALGRQMLNACDTASIAFGRGDFGTLDKALATSNNLLLEIERSLKEKR